MFDGIRFYKCNPTNSYFRCGDVFIWIDWVDGDCGLGVGEQMDHHLYGRAF